jgi:ribosomal protein L17
MRHRKSGRKLGRNSAHRKAMFRNMVTSLLRHDTIRTTLPKAKELRHIVEPIITLARKHPWSSYEAIATELNETLNTLEGSFTTDEGKASYAFVQSSASKVSTRFPSGLGRLLSILNSMGDSVSTQAEVVGRARIAQMARQHALSQAQGTIMENDVLERLFGELAELYKDRNGGYTRVIRDGHRDGDNADMAYISLVMESLSSSSSESAGSSESAE